MRAYHDMLALIDFTGAEILDHLVHGETKWGLREMQATEEFFGVEVE
ncbi:hypothetical protein [Micromonospora sp. GCM10011541]